MAALGRRGIALVALGGALIGCAPGLWPSIPGSHDGPQCDRGSVEACRAASALFRTRDEDRKYAHQAEQRGCELGDGYLCERLAEDELIGYAIARSKESGVRHLVRGCELGYARACEHAMSYADPSRMLELGCRAGDARACARGAERALSRNEKARAGKHLTAMLCRDRAAPCEALVAEYLTLDAHPPRPDLALPLYDAACAKSQPNACLNAGLLKLDPQAGEVDRGAAARLLRPACAEGSRAGCVGLAQAIGVEDASGARAALERACGADDACLLAGGRLVAGSGGASAALPIFERACAANEASACVDAGQALVAAGQGAKAKQRFERACQARVGSGCTHLAALYESGTGVNRDGKLAASFARQGCDLGDRAACPLTHDLRLLGRLASLFGRAATEWARDAQSDAARAFVLWPIHAAASVARIVTKP